MIDPNSFPYQAELESSIVGYNQALDLKRNDIALHRLENVNRLQLLFDKWSAGRGLTGDVPSRTLSNGKAI